MIAQDSTFYDIMATSLGDYENFQSFVDDLFANKYNAPNTEGFSWDPEIQMDFSYEQLEAEMGIHAMATFVDVDSPAPLRGLEGFTTSTGKIPRFKHGFRLNEKIIREKMLFMQKFGKIDGRSREALMELMFNSTDQLLGGNYNTLNFMRNSAISTGKIEITSTNNPQGIQNLTFDFKVPAANKNDCGGFGSQGTKYVWTAAEAEPIGDLIDMDKYARDNFMPNGSGAIFEMNADTWYTFWNHPNVRKRVILAMSPTMSEANASATFVMPAQVKTFLAGMGLPDIRVIDSLVSVQKYNKVTRRVENTNVKPFAATTVVLVPKGTLGTIKAVEPIVVPDPASRVALYDGGRTVIKQTFDGRLNTQNIESECTALVVPNRVKNFLYLDTATAAS